MVLAPGVTCWGGVAHPIWSHPGLVDVLGIIHGTWVPLELLVDDCFSKHRTLRPPFFPFRIAFSCACDKRGPNFQSPLPGSRAVIWSHCSFAIKVGHQLFYCSCEPGWRSLHQLVFWLTDIEKSCKNSAEIWRVPL